MPSTKRLHDSHDGTPVANKVARPENGDFSGAVKKKLSGASRTGQACDRCKVRKIRCDARPGGCSPCLQNNTECKTTDRITGRATSRGYTENVEVENNALKQHIAELLQQLQENGIDPRSGPAANVTYAPEPTVHQSYAGTENAYSLSSILNQEDDVKGPYRGTALPEFQADEMGGNYLGVSSSNGWPLPITGTHHALFGMHLDLKDFVAVDGNERSAALTYQAFNDFIYSAGIHEAPVLPPYEQLRTLCEWFFKSINAWLPVLHKSTFFALLDRVHHDPTYIMTAEEKVNLHMVVTIMLYQYSTRNSMFHENTFLDHYKYALGFIHELITEATLPAIQSLTLIVCFLRAFPRPGPAWSFSSVVLTKAIEIGLHRSASAWTPDVEIDAHQAEMRKRIFWTLLTCHVLVGAKLGRPLIIRVEDFDIELPKLIPDCLPDENPTSEWASCSFATGVFGFKHTILYMQIYTSMYSVRPTSFQPYEEKLKQMDKEIDAWYASLPAELRAPNLSPQERVFALYTEHGYQHLRLLLHHPASCPSSNQDLVTRNLDVSLEASSKLLQIGQGMRDLKSLDTTWFNTTIFLAAIFTTLFAYLERSDQITSEEFTNLRNDMDSWLEIMGDIGQLLGSGPLLQNALRQIVSSALANISKHLAAKTASAAVATVAVSRSPSGQSGIDHRSNYQQPPQFNTSYPSHDHDVTPDATAGTSYLSSNDHLPPQQHSFPQSTTFAYPEPAHTTLPTYSTAPMTFDTSNYNEDIKPDLGAQLAVLHHATSHSHTQSATPTQAQTNPSTHAPPQQPQPQQNPNFYAFPNGSPAHSNSSHGYANANTNAWRQFADTMMTNISPHWSANALMALQGQQQQQQQQQQGQQQPTQPQLSGQPQPQPQSQSQSTGFTGGRNNGPGSSVGVPQGGGKVVGNGNGGPNDSPVPGTEMGLDANGVDNGHGVGLPVGFDIMAHPQNWPVMGHYT